MREINETASVLTSTNSKDVDADEEGNLGVAIFQQRPGTTRNDEDVTETTEHDAPENHGVATKPGIGQVCDEEGQAVGKEIKGLAGGVGYLFTETQGTLSCLATFGDGAEAIAADREGAVDVVGPNQSAAVVGSSFAKLYRAQQVCGGGQGSRDATKSLHLFVGRLALVVLVENLDIMVAMMLNGKVFFSALGVGKLNSLAVGNVDLLFGR